MVHNIHERDRMASLELQVARRLVGRLPREGHSRLGLVVGVSDRLILKAESRRYLVGL